MILTTFDADEYVVEALRAGASGFLLKDVAPADFVNAIRIIASGEALISPSVTRRLLDRFARLSVPADETHAERLRDLTEREREVLKLVAHGLSNREIAERLVLGRAHREDPRLAPAPQARRARSRAARRAGVRAGHRSSRGWGRLIRQDEPATDAPVSVMTD